MEHYYLSKEPSNDGEHIIHKSGCNNLPDVENRIYMGYLSNDSEALDEAKEYYPAVNGCCKCLDTSKIKITNIKTGIKDM
ncbi:MAG: hypothetical protein R6W90_17050 [Ignavibacteriaceae bacterium]